MIQNSINGLLEKIKKGTEIVVVPSADASFIQCCLPCFYDKKSFRFSKVVLNSHSKTKFIQMNKPLQ